VQENTGGLFNSIKSTNFKKEKLSGKLFSNRKKFECFATISGKK
jgi:hypothetical protein